MLRIHNFKSILLRIPEQVLFSRAPRGNQVKRPEVEEMLATVARSLVDRPEEVSVVAIPGDVVTFRIMVDPSDRGKLIGVNGRTARALRILLLANATKLNQKMALDIVANQRQDGVGVLDS